MSTLFCLMLAISPQNPIKQAESKRDFTVDISIKNIDRIEPLNEVWRRPIGKGYSGLAVAGETVISHDRRGDFESVVAFKLENGHERWRLRYRAPAHSSMIAKYGFGPHSTPWLTKASVFVVGGTGLLKCIDKTTGKLKWEKDLWSEFGGTKLERGYAASPNYFEGKLILPVGGKESGIVAFEEETGAIAWQSTDLEASYSSPIITEIAGKTQLVCLMANKLVATALSNGQALWSFDFRPINTVHVATPIALTNGRIFVVSSNVAMMLQVTKSNSQKFVVEKIWETQRMTYQVGNTIQIEDQILGPSSTSSSAVLTALGAPDGKRLWQNRMSGIGFLYKTRNGFIAISESGKITFNRLENGLPKTLATHKGELKGRIWNVAAFSGNSIIVRDESSIIAYRIQTTPK